jgi:polyhydroxyalkanoate synthesis regulator phasin
MKVKVKLSYQISLYTVFHFQETKEKVKLIRQLADSLVEKGHTHAANIKKWVEEVEARHNEFNKRMESYRVKLDSSLDVNSEVGVIK